MKLSSILSEAFRNLSSGNARVGSFVLVLSAVLVAFASVDAKSVVALADEAYEFERIGGNTYVANLEGQIDRSWCEGLSALPEVRMSGAVANSSARWSIDRIPDSPIPVYDASPGILPLLRSDYTGATIGVVLSADLAQDLAQSAGSFLTLVDGEQIAVGGSFPSDDRGPRFDFVVFNVNPVRVRFDECWYVVNDQQSASVVRLALSADAKERQGLTIEGINPTAGTSSDPIARFLQRPTRYNAALAGVAGVLIGVLYVLRRRTQHASAMQLGVRRLDLMAIIVVEMAAVALLACSIAGAIYLSVLGHDFQSERAALGALFMRSAASTIVGCLLGVAISTIGIRRRSYYAYFRAG